MGAAAHFIHFSIQCILIRLFLIIHIFVDHTLYEFSRIDRISKIHNFGLPLLFVRPKWKVFDFFQNPIFLDWILLIVSAKNEETQRSNWIWRSPFLVIFSPKIQLIISSYKNLKNIKWFLRWTKLVFKGCGQGWFTMSHMEVKPGV